MPVSDEELEFHKQWSACAGKLAGLHSANSFLLNAAPRHFMEGKNEMAEEIRRLSLLINHEIELASKNLKGFIESSRRPQLVRNP